MKVQGQCRIKVSEGGGPFVVVEYIVVDSKSSILDVESNCGSIDTIKDSRVLKRF